MNKNLVKLGHTRMSQKEHQFGNVQLIFITISFKHPYINTSIDTVSIVQSFQGLALQMKSNYKWKY